MPCWLVDIYLRSFGTQLHAHTKETFVDGPGQYCYEEMYTIAGVTGALQFHRVVLLEMCYGAPHRGE